MTTVSQKWNNLSESDRNFVEQIIDQLIVLKKFPIPESEYQENLNRLEKMKEEPAIYSKDAFEAIREIRTKLNNASG
ncbi:MAG TPA: hypothetical protein PKY12_16160 [Catalimonadaceae bacterium]|jgi:hypothetical protein|nr:hypothetical protein [Catalimonadaceae bacterium]